MSIWFELSARGSFYPLSGAEAHRFLAAAGRRETEALFELWYERIVASAETDPGSEALFGAPDSPLCCATPEWETVHAGLDRAEACDIDLECCRRCAAWRLTTNWPKDSPDRNRGMGVRIPKEDAEILREADWERRRGLLDGKRWYGLSA